MDINEGGNGQENSLKKKWLVFYTKSRAEKKAHEFLMKSGFESFLPLQTVVKQWSDRKKKVEVPLFNSYIFVYEHEHRITEILKVPSVAWNIRHAGKPATLREEAVETIKRFIDTGYFMETFAIDELQKGDEVEVVDGPLRGVQGVLTGEYNEEKFSIIMETIDQVITLSIDKRLLKKIG